MEYFYKSDRPLDYFFSNGDASDERAAVVDLASGRLIICDFVSSKKNVDAELVYTSENESGYFNLALNKANPSSPGEDPESIASFLVWLGYDVSDAEKVVQAYEEYFQKPFHLNLEKFIKYLDEFSVDAKISGDEINNRFKKTLGYFGLSNVEINIRVSFKAGEGTPALIKPGRPAQVKHDQESAEKFRR